MSRCPCLAENHNFYPDNTCKCQWNYCMHLGDYKECDVFKRHDRTIQYFKEAMKGAIKSGKD